MPELTPEQEAFIAEELGNELAVAGDDIAEYLGIPPMSEREWTDEESSRVWAELEERMRPSLIAKLLDPDWNPAAEPALPK